MHGLRQRHRFGHATILDIAEVRLHDGNIQLGPAGRGMRFDPTIGDDQNVTGGHPAYLMRADAAAVKLARARIAMCRVPDSDDAAPRLIVVLGRIKPAAIQRERAMPVEMPPLRRAQLCALPPGGAVDHDRKGAGTAGKGDCFGAAGMGGGGVAACGQINAKAQAHIRADPAQRKAASRQPRRR